MNKIRTSIDQLKPRLVAHVNTVLKDLIDMVSQDAKTNMDRGDYEDAAQMLRDVVQYKKDAEQFIAMVEGSRFAETIIANIQENINWYGPYFMEDTLQIVSVMFDVQFEVEH